MRSVRAGIVVTGTEVLAGRVRDRNGPWLADRLRELGVDLAHVAIVGDRPADMLAALRFMAAEGLDLLLTSGGLGPTADDLTAAVVGDFQGREMVLDAALEGRIEEILRRALRRWPNIDLEAIAAGNRKQATVPRGATVLEPVGTAPGLVVPPVSEGAGPTVVVLPGPPRELQPMWSAAIETAALQAVLAGATEYRQHTLRLFGIPESEIAETLRVAEGEGVTIGGPGEQGALEVTTCLRGGELEVVTRYEPDAEASYAQFVRIVRARHADTLFSEDGSTVGEQLAALLAGEAGGAARTIAVAESCTGGLLLGRLTDPPGASRYVLGGVVAYSNDVKIAEVRVPADLIERHGAVSVEVARALADGVRARLGADVGVGVTGIAGPGGGSEEKPVGLVCISVTEGTAGRELTRSLTLPGGRSDVRERACTVALHLIRRLLADSGT